LDEDVAEEVLDAAQSQVKAVLAEVRLETIRARSVSVREGRLASVISKQEGCMNVRIVLPSGIGFAATNSVSKSAGLELVKRAVKLAKNVRQPESIAMSPEPAVNTDWAVSQGKPLSDISIEDRVEMMRSADEAVRRTKVKASGRYLEFKDYEISGHFANSEGSRIRSFVPRLKLESYIMVSAGGDSEQSSREWGGTGGWEVAESWNVDRALADEVLMLKKMIEKGKRVPPGKYDLVCGPEVAGIAAHESCGHPMEADRIQGREMSQAGKSFVSPEMLGSRIGSEYATVIDDPTVPGSYGYYAYDQEGVRVRPRYLYKEGIMNEFLTNRESAGALGARSNASSRSETCMMEPIVRMANTYVAPGDYEDDEIFGSVKNGVLMHSFTEWNIDDKRYNQKYVSREAYFIRDGELAEPARNCVLEITTPGFWGAIDATSKNLELQAAECGKGDPGQGMAVFAGGPMLRLRGVMLR